MHPIKTLAFALALTCGGARVARADDVAAAKLIFDQGVENMKAQKYEVGCKQIAESVRLDRRPGALYTLARCEADWGRLATAVARFDEYLQFCTTLSDAEKAKQTERLTDAQERRDKLAPDVPRWTITLAPNAPPNTAVKRNGEPFGPALLGVELPVDPGVYVFSTQVPGGPMTEKRIEIVKGTANPIVLEVMPAPVVAVPPDELVKPLVQEASTPPRRTAGWVLFGLGGVVLGGGFIAGATVLANKEVIDSNCGAAVGFAGMPTRCNDIGRDAGESAKIAATVASVGVAVGAVGLVTGVIMVATAPKSASPRKSSLVHDVTFDLGPANFGGIVGGFRGTW